MAKKKFSTRSIIGLIFILIIGLIAISLYIWFTPRSYNSDLEGKTYQTTFPLFAYKFVYQGKDVWVIRPINTGWENVTEIKNGTRLYLKDIKIKRDVMGVNTWLAAFFEIPCIEDKKFLVSLQDPYNFEKCLKQDPKGESCINYVLNMEGAAIN